MRLQALTLTNFRSYSKQIINLAPLTIIVGKNTAGKTNILEAIHILSTGKSFRAEKDIDTIQFSKNFSRVDGLLQDDSDSVKITVQLLNNSATFHKRYLLNDVGKSLNSFVSIFCSILFSPQDLEIISESPTLRRKYLNSVLTSTSSTYRSSLTAYTKALRQRNKLLRLIREGKRSYNLDEFSYWNDLLLEHGNLISEQREKYVEFINEAQKDAYDIEVEYDSSLITPERLEKYKNAELASGVTLIGPQRDDLNIYFAGTKRLIREFASRGEQRLAVLQLKLLEIEYVELNADKKPVLLLDDIFSELDSQNISHISHLFPGRQTIITTTHTEYIPNDILDQSLILKIPEDLEAKK